MHTNVFRDCVEHMALPYLRVARWIKASREGGGAVPDNLRIEQRQKHSATPCFPVGCWSLMDCTLLSSSSRNMSQSVLHILHDILSTANLQRIGYALKFTRCNNVITMQSQGRFGSVPKERWLLFWTNSHYERNQGSLIRTKLETPIKWMEESRFSSSKESAPYTMRFEDDVHCGVWQWWGNIALRCIFKAAYYCTFLQHHLRPAFRRKLRYLMVQNPITLHDNARSHTADAATDLLCLWKWEILEHPPYSPDMSPCDYDLFAIVKEPLWESR